MKPLPTLRAAIGFVPALLITIRHLAKPAQLDESFHLVPSALLLPRLQRRLLAMLDVMVEIFVQSETALVDGFFAHLVDEV